MMIVAGTGHRPDKLGGYSMGTEFRLWQLALDWFEPQRQGVSGIISGMAQGWDWALANVALELGIPLHCAVPFEGQESKWPAARQREYRDILRHAASVTIVCPGGYDPAKMQIRNEWMVDRCHILLALWDGSSGGTGNCIRYARQVPRPIVNLWGRWAG